MGGKPPAAGRGAGALPGMGFGIPAEAGAVGADGTGPLAAGFPIRGGGGGAGFCACGGGGGGTG